MLNSLFFLLLILAKSNNGLNTDNLFPVSVSSPDSNNVGFGRSIALEAGNIYVGAPKHDNHGAVYKCQDVYGINSPGNCKIISQNVIIYEENCKRTGELIGNSVAVNNGKLLIGAPGWYTCLSETYKVIGMCFITKDQEDFTSILDLNKVGDHVTKFGNYTAYKYGYAQAGISIHVDADEQPVVGAIGVLSRGTVFIAKPNGVLDVFFGYYDANQDTTGMYNDVHVGYAVTSGKFNGKDIWYATGAPRYDVHKTGLVIVFDANGHLKNKIESKEQFSYFGSALTVGTVSARKTIDLIIGAPTCTFNGLERGCVHVYQYDKNTQEFKNVTALYGESKFGRFGTAISNIGNVNYDQYDDIAISAPYENNGVVYLYFGSSEGLNQENCQKITPSGYSGRGFGYSISNGADYDRNGLNDFAVGSTDSNQIYLYLSKHILSLKGTITPSIEFIAGQNKFNVRYCLSYDTRGTNKFKPFNVAITYFQDEPRIAAPIGKNEVLFIPNPNICMNINVTLNPEIDRDSNLILKIHQKYITNGAICTDITDCPAINGNGENDAIETLQFVHECGSDEKCDSDLVLETRFENDGPFIHGVNKSVTLHYDIRNNGPELAPNYKLTFKAEQAISLLRSKPECKQNDEKTIECSYKEKIKPQQSVQDAITFDLEKILPTTQSFSLTSIVSSENTSRQSEAWIEIEKDYNLTIRCVNLNTTVFITETENDVTHKFLIKNSGRSKIYDAEIVLDYQREDYEIIEFKFNNETRSEIHDKVHWNLTKIDDELLVVEMVKKYQYGELQKSIDATSFESRVNITVRNNEISESARDFINVHIRRGLGAAYISAIVIIIIILLAIIVFVLYKCDFFKRNKYQKLLENSKSGVQTEAIVAQDFDDHGSVSITEEEKSINSTNYDN